MTVNVIYGNGQDATAAELGEFYERICHPLHASPEALEQMVHNSAAVVTARVDGKLVGLARGITDGLRGYLAECKLDPRLQGPAAITRTEGRVEHDTSGIARSMAQRVLDKMIADGVQRIDTLAWGTEVDFAEELGFKRNGGLTVLTLVPSDRADANATAEQAQVPSP